MLRNKRTVMWLLASVVLCGFLAVSSLAAPPPGKGGGNGGGGNEEPALPADLDVRYRVQFMPLPASVNGGLYLHDVNEEFEAVGRYDDVDGFRIGFYYDAATDTLLTINEMVILPARWVNTSLVGINNDGVIVGMARDSFNFNQCLLIYPSEEGYSYEITSPVNASGDNMNSHFTKINDSGDIVGIGWDSEGVGRAFAYNPGIFPAEAPDGFRDFTFFGAPGAWWDSMQVTNSRLGMVRRGPDMSWFDFLDGQESLALLPENERSQSVDDLSHDGQYTVNEVTTEGKGKNNKNGTYRYTPGIMVAGDYVWRGNLDDGQAERVNSAVGPNAVGDVVGMNRISNVRWLRHADHPEWGYLDLSEMLVFSSIADEGMWSLIPSQVVGVNKMSDRDLTTGFGVLVGWYSAPFSGDTQLAYLLIPEIITP